MTHKVNRRDFFKLLGLNAAGTTFLKEAAAAPVLAGPAENKPTFALGPLKLNKAREHIATCTDCHCGCKLLVRSEGNQVIQVERLTGNSGDDGSIRCDLDKFDTHN